MFKHVTDLGGDPWKKVIRQNGVRRSTRAETAIAQNNTPTYNAFSIDLTTEFGEEHSVVELSTKVLRSTNSSENSLVKAMEESADSMLETIAMALDHKIMGDGGGAKGRVVPSSVSTNTLQLQDLDDLYFWYVGMRVQAAPDNGKTAAAGVRAGVLEVSGIATDGTITFTQNVTIGIPDLDDTGAVTAVDFLFEEDDYDGQAERIIQGIRGWVPATAPGSSDSWFDVNRSTHESVLAGSRVDGAGAHAMDVVKDALGRTKQNRGKPDFMVVGTFKMVEFDQIVGAKTEFMMETDYPDIGIKGIRVVTPHGPIDVVVQPGMPSAEAVTGKRDTFIIGSIGDVPHEVDDDGQTWRVVTTKSAVQLRYQAFCQTMLTEPWHWCHITW
jgi:hypothetical protein